MDLSTDIWELATKLITLVAIPHAAALGLSKVVNISSRPRVGTVAKVLDAGAYFTLALTSALIVHGFFSAIDATPADIAEARSTMTLRLAFEMYALIYGFATAALGSFVMALKVALHTRNLKAFLAALAAFGIFVLGGWVVFLDKVATRIGIESVHPAAVVALTLGPPLLAVAAIAGIRFWEARETADRAAE